MYKRVLLKLSGEALKENSDMILDGKCLDSMANMVKSIHDAGIQVCIVIGAGNIWRGKIAKDAGMEQFEADFMGMMGTVINAVALSAKLKLLGVPSLVTTAIGPVPEVNVPSFRVRPVCRGILRLHQGCQVPFRTSRQNVGLLLSRCSGQGPHLALMGEPRGFSRVSAGFSSYDVEFRLPIVLAQGSPIFNSICEGT